MRLVRSRSGGISQTCLRREKKIECAFSWFHFFEGGGDPRKRFLQTQDVGYLHGAGRRFAARQRDAQRPIHVSCARTAGERVKRRLDARRVKAGFGDLFKLRERCGKSAPRFFRSEE